MLTPIYLKCPAPVQWTGDSKHSSNFPRVCDAKKLSICQCPGSDNAYFIMGYNGPKFVQITEISYWNTC